MESNQTREPWNKGSLIEQKPPLKPKDIWAIHIRLQNAHQVRDLAMFNLAIDSKLRGGDLVNLRVCDITHGNQILTRTMTGSCSIPQATASIDPCVWQEDRLPFFLQMQLPSNIVNGYAIRRPDQLIEKNRSRAVHSADG